jgi:hypothetical protein
MRPFDLAEALAGAKVMTSDKKPVTDIAYFPSISSVYKVCAVICGDVCYFAVDGHYSNKEHDTRDLFMETVMKEGWINIYKGGKSKGNIYKTKEEAQAASAPDMIACIRIEWEE